MYFCRSGVCVEVCYGQLSRPVDRSLEVDKRLRGSAMSKSMDFGFSIPYLTE
ncbi:hypothetical protein F2Q68_00031886 [Brassica cretica]|uniref:Uncharacterized protein n=1 Tax=Brassica cretica TaxID=69181 RepID=A0A8S9G979_BRACR|nr:hypothetical protein F2Q68_00031886 [Brassica cretica]